MAGCAVIVNDWSNFPGKNRVLIGSFFRLVFTPEIDQAGKKK